MKRYRKIKTVYDYFSPEEMKIIVRKLPESKKAKGFSQEEKNMIDFLIDAQNHFDMTAKNFKIWNDNDSLIHIMTNPTVITDLTGGHLALLVKFDKYVDTVCDYIMRRTE